MDEQATAIARLLEKKATFSQGLRELSVALTSCAPNNDQKVVKFASVLPRLMVLLKSRYTNPALWREASGVLRLFEARCSQRAETLSSTSAVVQKYLGEVEAFLTQHDLDMPDVAISREAFAAAALANVPLEDIMLGIGAGARQVGGGVRQRRTAPGVGQGRVTVQDGAEAGCRCRCVQPPPPPCDLGSPNGMAGRSLFVPDLNKQ